MLLAATSEGVYRADRMPFESVEHVFDGGAVRQLHAEMEGSATFAATDAGLFRTVDGGDTWHDLELPVADVYSVLATDDRLYAGVQPAGVFVSTDRGETWESTSWSEAEESTGWSGTRDSTSAGETWERLSGFERLAAGSDWPTNPHHEHACVRSLATPPDATGVLLAGVEVGGLAVSADAGETWQTVTSVPDDVHHVLPVTDERWVVSCGTGGPDGDGGVFESRDAGETWTRRDTGEYRYARESCYRDRLYTAGNRTAPLWTPPDAALFVETADGGLESTPYPGEPTAFIISWATAGDALLAGTNDGRILRGRDGRWREVGAVPVGEDDQRAFGVRSLTTVHPTV